MACSKKRFIIDKQSDPVEFVSWLLNSLHFDLTGGKVKKSSIITQCFQVRLGRKGHMEGSVLARGGGGVRLLNSLHFDLTGGRVKKSSSITQCFQERLGGGRQEGKGCACEGWQGVGGSCHFPAAHSEGELKHQQDSNTLL